MTAFSSSETAADHLQVSATTASAGGGSEAPPRGRQIDPETAISTLANAIIELANAVKDLQSHIEHSTDGVIETLTHEIRTLATNIEVFRPN